MAVQPARADETAEGPPAGLVALLDRIGPLPYWRGRWRCPSCGETSAAAEDFQSGLYLERGRCVRRHPPRRTLRCLLPSCRHVEVVDDPPAIGTDRPPADRSAEGDAGLPVNLRRLLKPMLPAPPAGPTRPVPRPCEPAEPRPRPEAGEVDAVTAWRRVRHRLHQLFEALADFDEAGGMAAAGSALGWNPRRWAKHLGLIGMLRRMLGDAMRRGRDERGPD